jgi:hypothetical protein
MGFNVYLGQVRPVFELYGKRWPSCRSGASVFEHKGDGGQARCCSFESDLNRELKFALAVIIEQKQELVNQVSCRFAFFEGLVHKGLSRWDQVGQALQGCGRLCFSTKLV